MLKKGSYQKLTKQLNLLGFKTYQDFLQSSLWKVFRKQVRESHDIKSCMKCKKEGAQLYFHHLSYKCLLDPRQILIICNDCHLEMHDKPAINHGIKQRERIQFNK